MTHPELINSISRQLQYMMNQLAKNDINGIVESSELLTTYIKVKSKELGEGDINQE